MQEVQAMIREHDAWSKMGEEHLGEGNIRWAERCGDGGFILMKAIMNDHWADVRKYWKNDYHWDRDDIDKVMSKLYWCWVALLEHMHPEAESEAPDDVLQEQE
tara:strand:- start:95 stop:403 length:309 start_codon:yes stop_codon:yes gene_type:complete